MFKTLLSTLVILLALGTTNIEAKTFTYSQVHNMPRSVEKDYYIWRFLNQRSTTASQARAIIKEVNNTNKKLREAYKKKTGVNPPNITHKPYVTEQQKADWKHQAEGNKLFDEGIRLVQKKKLQRALTYFHKAHEVYLKRWEKDKSLFWIYLLTKEKKYLYKIKRDSTHINMYTLLAADITHSQYPKSIITPRVSRKSVSHIDETNPIHWAKMKIKVKKPDADLTALAEDCESQATIGMNTYIKAKACNYRKSYFPMPYRNIMKQYPVERQALIYAIARQESRFVPASVSRSFALGMMQFMPFLIDHVAKKTGRHIDYDDMFNPKVAIEFANFHLDYLNKWLYHPLFVAYAYNGGIGFTKKLIKNRRYFRPGPFEPYLSMEKITNVEAREYGKRVLTNYVIYMNKLGKSTRLLPYIKTLTNPSKTDRFR
ncbi:lytic transglycosylase domain-containing protein [Sulfurovum riftiae]|uniref:Lytic murein transglycosylase n=1 Tax=Sulfurovum riftiae TaxID=1630136 RepID=A0A151CHL7_9BACT|nr:lytic transglycosylase domain-containing protein [Sulfurovum riftiae]KYJ87011.1 lytic murein transglycosylase [Sulfurovum riftiae]